MGLLLYKLSIWFYWLFVKLAAPFHSKAAKMISGRKNLFAEIGSKLAGNQSPVVWFHCASLGEFEQGRPVMEAFAKKYPNYKIVLTFFSPSGYEVRKNYAGAHFIFYLPSDSVTNAKRFIDLVKPRLVIYVKYEFWHFYISELKSRSIPVISIAAIFRESQLFFKPYGKFYRNILANFTHIFTQNQQSVNLLNSIGINQASIAGDTRFDRVLQTAASVKQIPVVEKFKAHKPVFVIGSSWPQDMEVLKPFMQKHLSELKFIIAPHEIHENEIVALIQDFNGNAIRFSEAQKRELNEFSVLVIDNVGMLSSLYGYGNFAYIGGAFGKGLHNTLEAAVFGLPLFFGPNYLKFQEAIDLVNLQTAFPVQNTTELEAAFNKVIASPENSTETGKKLSHYIAEKAGATKIIMNWISKII